MAGRPKKANSEPKKETKIVSVDTDDIKVETKNDSDIIAELMAQVKALTETVQKQESEKTDMKELIETLKSSQNVVAAERKRDLPSKTKVVSLMQNQYNLSTLDNGQGKVFSFPKFGHVITMRTSDLEDVMSISKYREQAEKGYFYICDADVVEELGLTDDYKNIIDEDAMKHVLKLSSDSAVDMFCSMDRHMQDSISTKIAENIMNNKPVDRNRVFEIKRKTNIDIEKMAEDLREANEKMKKK